MASSSSIGFSVGKLTQQIKDWYSDPANDKNPLKSYLECLPNKEYTNSEFQGLKLELNNINVESINFESKRINTEVISLLNQIETVECLGEDATFLFGGFVEYCQEFIDYYNEIKDTIPLASDVNQNPNYYNN